MGMPEDDFKPFARKRKNVHVTFNEEEDVINPGTLFNKCSSYWKWFQSLAVIFSEDIDPTVGRFRNLVQTAIIPTKVFQPDLWTEWELINLRQSILAA